MDADKEERYADFPVFKGLQKPLEFMGFQGRYIYWAAGTAAVHLALIGCGVKAGDEVLVQSFTFCASSHPITYLGAKPVFVGSERETWNMDPALLEKAIIDRKEKTGKYPKAIVPVALYGMPYRIDEIMGLLTSMVFLWLKMPQRVWGHASMDRCLVRSASMECCRLTKTR